VYFGNIDIDGIDIDSRPVSFSMNPSRLLDSICFEVSPDDDFWLHFQPDTKVPARIAVRRLNNPGFLGDSYSFREWSYDSPGIALPAVDNG
jgi:hypothetical protein